MRTTLFSPGFLAFTTLSTLTALASNAGILAQTPEFTLEQVLSSPLPSSLVAAPSGGRVAWVHNRAGTYSIWVADRSGDGDGDGDGDDDDLASFRSREVHAFEGDSGRAITLIGFSADGQSIVFRRAGGHNPTHRVDGAPGPTTAVLSLRTKLVQQLAGAATATAGALSPTDARMVYAKGGQVYLHDLHQERGHRLLRTRGTVSQLAWSPDGQQLVMTVARRSFDEKYSWIAVFDFKTLRYLNPSTYQDSRPRWSPNGRRVAFLRRLTPGADHGLLAKRSPQPDPWEVRLADVASGRATAVLARPEPHSFQHARLRWRDDERLVYRSERSGWHRLYEIHTAPTNADRPPRPRPRPISPPASVVDSFAIDAFGTLYFTSNAHDEDRRHLWWAALGEDARLWTRGASIEWGACPLPGTNLVAHYYATARDPASIAIRGAGHRRSQPLGTAAMPADFPRDQLVVPEAVLLTAADGQRIHAQLFRPPPRYRGRRPAVMFFHGGPIRQMLLGWHHRGYYHRAYAFNQYLAAKGYYVLSINFRLGVGYGRQFREVTRGGPRGASEYQDLLAGHAWLAEQELVDPLRIGLWGGSYGGLMTALGLARDSDKFAAGVDFHGVHDWNLWQAWVRGDDRPGTDPVAAQSSPRANLDGWRAPVLLIHGDDDQNVPFAETIWLARELDRRGVDHELLVLPGEVHSFLLHRSWLKAFGAAAGFLDRKLRDKATPHGQIRAGSWRYQADLGSETITVFTYRPKNFQGHRMIMVMHGTLRNAGDYRDHAIAMGDRLGALIVAPRFDRRRFPSRRYHQGGILGRDGKVRPAAQWTYKMIPRLAKVMRAMVGQPDMPYWIIGHSAGGQFVARMSAFQDTGAVRHIAANPGSHLFPTRDMPLPYGFGKLPAELSDDAALARYLAAPLTIYLGTADDKPDQYFNMRPVAMRQGTGRLQRGRKCFATAKALAEQHGWAFNWRLVLAPGVGHDHQAMFNHESCEKALFGN